MDHLSLSFAGEFSAGPVYHCPICNQDLWTRRNSETNWQEWYFTKDGRRHYKNHCNLLGREKL